MALRTSTKRGRRGRPRKNEEISRWSISLPTRITAPWDLIFLDPVTGNPKLNVRQFILGELLRMTMNAWQNGETTIDISAITHRITHELKSSEHEA